jgi:glycosyltransferase involved in cell wall biosynthesis
MKILQVVHNFIDTNLAGSELYTYYLCRELKKKHAVAVFYYKKNESNQFDLERGHVNDIQTYVARVPTTDLYKWSFLQYRNSAVDDLFMKVLSEFRPDVVHLQHLLYASMNFPTILHRLGIPMVQTLHDYYLICPCFKLLDYRLRICEEVRPIRCFVSILSILHSFGRKHLVRKIVTDFHYCANLFQHTAWKRKRFIKRNVFRHVDLFISPSEFLREKFIEYGLRPERIIYSGNGMNYELTEKYHRGKRNEIEPMTFGYIGGHQVEKGVPLLIDAFNGIKNARLFIYGSGKETEYKKMIKSSNIFLKGRVEDHKKAEAFGQLDFLVVPSIWYENAPLTIHEAFMFKVPVLTSNIGGMAEAVKDGINGLHFRVADPGDLRRKMEYCISHPEEVARMGQNTPRVKSIEENATEIEKIYSRLIPFRRLETRI